DRQACYGRKAKPDCHQERQIVLPPTDLQEALQSNGRWVFWHKTVPAWLLVPIPKLPQTRNSTTTRYRYQRVYNHQWFSIKASIQLASLQFQKPANSRRYQLVSNRNLLPASIPDRHHMPKFPDRLIF